MEFRVECLEAVGSTNEVVKEALEAGEPEGLVVRARRQTGGYGRQGRTWASPEGGLYMSLLLRPSVPPAQLPTLSLVVGLAVRRALASLVTLAEARRIQVKWPNDVVYAEAPAAGERRVPAGSMPDAPGAPGTGGKAFRKLCGISLEAHGGGVCVGIGVNVLPPARPAELPGKNAPAYLADLGYGFTCEARGAVDEVAAAVLRELAPLYERWEAAGLGPLVPEYDACAALAGRALTVADRNGAVLAEGTAVGIDEHGRLLIRRPDGTEHPVSSGEAHIL
ncbi:biotin--[acetyl-CoA-carboxylase] ligase [Adlercreutzia faecimuris]|uniref:biotin--[biotin carboxyl-carrier protein] ligase n=1 Tax=Adlercreutzia faecimuris TaxID=2897341 RepID=A0ABS9WFK2_9ACTN|nr:biotin--[acetyl-CoA-carboxylase] ligase [Adlercreutzia sp. JBNU-10]MCI2241262.1 biotin--[acetyl-CoA-carboxylase] ligase [Adlercreutzia sp. JBNU-10]